MGWFKNKADPISDRARVLNAEIAALEDEIRKLDAQLEQGSAHPRLRSTAMPHGPTVAHTASPPAPVAQPAAAPAEPVFEEVDQEPLKARAEMPTTAEHYNELGVRKYDLTALLRRVQNHFHGPTATNPKLINYLAAGSIHGLRPLRYEKRVARRRFIVLAVFLLLVLLGIISMFVRNR